MQNEPLVQRPMKIAILIVYGIILLLIGIYSQLKVKTPSDYFLAGKKTGVWQISGSLLATILGGSAIFRNNRTK